ncbi:MAG: hypothetical protein U0822_16525 [Anaerolineae bacterium]
MRRRAWISVILSLSVLLVLGQVASAADPRPDALDVVSAPVPNVFTFQGQIKQSGSPVSGACDLRFTLYNDATAGSDAGGGPQTFTGQAVANGLFTVGLPWGDSFTGDDRWVETAVRCPAGSGSYATLAPRQHITATPYAFGLRLPYGGKFTSSGDLFSVTNGGVGSAGHFVMTNPNAMNQAALVGESVASDGVQGISTSSFGVYGESATVAGIYGKTSSADNGGVVGVNSANGPGVEGYTGQGIGVHGQADAGYGVRGDSSGGIGVRGAGLTYGVYGLSTSNTGVRGHSTSGAGVDGDSDSGVGVFGSSSSSDGVHGVSNSFSGTGVYGSSRGTGVYGVSNGSYGIGVRGEGDTGVFGSSDSGTGVGGGSNTGIGVGGQSDSNDGVQGFSRSGSGVYGYASGGTGVSGKSDRGNGVSGLANDKAGVRGDATTGQGVLGYASSGIGVYGQSGTGLAGRFVGNVQVTGTLSKGGGSFKIDHPTDPANKYLYHSFVESPDMLDIYNGVVTTDAQGFATVTLPDWFQALNRDFRYQLTIVGKEWAQARIEEEIADNRFVIRTDKPNIKVSWLVTGIRQDAFANAHRIPVEEDKPAAEQGKYLYPKEHGQPSSLGIDQLKPSAAPPPAPSQAP